MVLGKGYLILKCGSSVTKSQANAFLNLFGKVKVKGENVYFFCKCMLLDI